MPVTAVRIVPMAEVSPLFAADARRKQPPSLASLRPEAVQKEASRKMNRLFDELIKTPHPMRHIHHPQVMPTIPEEI